jgi:multidrug efflux pump subunit AcrB
VTVENIHTHLARGKPLARAALDGTLETTLPRLLAMLCILAVFIPAFFMIGAAKALFVPLALAVGFAMFASFILSSTLVPVLSVWFLPKNSKHDEERLASLPACIRASSKPPSPCAGCSCPPISAGAALIIVSFGPFLGSEIFPKTDTGQFAIRFRAPSGTQVGITEKIAQKILQDHRREAGGQDKIEMSIGMVGVHNSSFPVNLVHLWNGGPEEGWLAVQLRHDSGVRVDPFQEKLREIMKRELPDVRLSFEPQDIVSRVMSFGSSTPIEVAVSGPSLPSSKEHAEKLLANLTSCLSCVTRRSRRRSTRPR